MVCFVERRSFGVEAVVDETLLNEHGEAMFYGARSKPSVAGERSVCKSSSSKEDCDYALFPLSDLTKSKMIYPAWNPGQLARAE